jgi:NAD(P)-dependent dehydrogenase (short-subunit alcohol dehydrogenase family)
MSGTILITGASRGIGAATARRFLAAGWQVGLFARDDHALAEVAAGAAGAHVLPGDVTDAGAVEHAVKKLAGASGRLDVLFNNAGVFAPQAPFDEVPLEAWRRSVEVNLTGMFIAARAAFGQMRRQDPQGGRIVNNGSVSAQVPRAGAAPYTATKHAVTGLTKQISLDGRAHGIACGQIDIGNARTDLLEEVVARAEAAGAAPPATMDVGHAADAVFRMATLPAEANVQWMTLMATTMPYIGRG